MSTIGRGRSRRTRTSSVRPRAARLLEEILARPDMGEGARLPALRTMAAAARVSLFTMAAAVSALVESRVLTAVHGKGVFKGSPPPVRPAREPAHRTVSSAQRVARALGQDLVAGRYDGHEQLPGFKELRRLYQASNASIRDALASLESSGIIERVRRTYRVRGPSPGRRRMGGTRSAIALVTAGAADGTPLFLNERSYELMRVIERECSQARVDLRVVPFVNADDERRTAAYCRALREQAEREPVIGYVVLGTLIARRLDVVRSLCETGLPLSVLIEREQDEILRDPGPNTRVCQVALWYGADCGTAVGQHLLSLGHHRVAYFDPYPGDLWPKERFEGIRQVYEMSGMGDAVHRMTLSPGSWDASQRIMSQFRALVRRICDSEPPALTAPLQRRFADFTRLLTFDQQFIFGFDTAMAAALGEIKATAWVGANDQTALVLLDFLRTQKLRVPQDVTVVGFDNHTEAQLNDLTSLDFNMAAAAKALVRYVLQPSMTRKALVSNRIEIAADLIVRGSSGAPASR